MNVKGAPRFTAVVGSKTNHESNSVDVLFRAADDERYKVELDPAIIPALLLAIAGHAAELDSNQGEHPIQPLPVKRISVAVSAAGGVSLMLQSESELKTVLSFSQDQAPAIRAILAELDEVLGRNLQ